MKQELLHCYEYGQNIFALFIDFKQAYDSINRKELYKALEELGIPIKLINLTKATLKETENKVIMGEKLSSSFMVDKGLRQGDPLSTVLFNLILEKVLRESCLNRSGVIYHKGHQCLAYADDLTILARTRKELEKSVANLEKPAVKVGLTINSLKTKFIKFRSSNEGTDNVKFRLFQSKILECELVKEVVFLGVVLTSKLNISQEIEARLAKRWTKDDHAQ